MSSFRKPHKLSSLILCCAFTFFLSACGGPKAPKPGNQLHLVLDDSAARKTDAGQSLIKLAPGLQNSMWDLASLVAPAATSDINCFVVNVTGAGIVPSPLSVPGNCTTPNNMAGRGFGVLSTPTLRGTSVSLSVPGGTGRRVDVYGIYPSVQECGGSPGGTSGAYLLGGTNFDLNDDVTLTVPVSFTSGTQSSLSCSPYGGPAAALFGTGTDGDVTFTASNITLSAHVLASTRYAMSKRRATNIDTATGTVLTLGAFAAIDFNVGDEVLIATMASSASACTTVGSALDPGFLKFAQITATNGSTTITIDSPVILAPANINNANIAVAPGTGTFCAIQVVRVPHFNNLTLNSPSAQEITDTAYDSITGLGGVLALRVNGTLTPTGLCGVNFNMNTEGFAAGAPPGGWAQGTQGQGTTGSGGAATAANGTGGGGGATDGAGGGGGAQSQIGGLGGGGGPPTPGAAGIGLGCDPENCLVLGGAGGTGGGANAVTGGLGGGGAGAIYIYARTVNLSTCPLSLNANGNTGQNPTGTTGGGGGGGAGGSILFYFKEKMGGPSVSTSALGGAGASSGGAGAGGGGGAGGRINVQNCTSSPAASTASNGGAGGTGGGGNGAAGGDGQVFNQGGVPALCAQ